VVPHSVTILAPTSDADPTQIAWPEASGLLALVVLVTKVIRTLDVVAPSVSVSLISPEKILHNKLHNDEIRFNSTENTECPSDKVCHNFRCINPCSTSCGVDSECTVRNHVTVCQCPKGFTGDPFVSCTPSSSSSVLGRQSMNLKTSFF
jgi:hypothetical protein